MRKDYLSKWFPLILLTLLPMLLHLSKTTVAEPAAATSPFTPTWDQGSLKRISTGDLDAVDPKIRVAPNGALLIAYDKNFATFNSDPYYSRSGNSGVAWTTAAPIKSTPGTRSVEVDIEFDSASFANAVWVEGFFDIVHTKSNKGASGWPNGIDTVFASLGQVVRLPELTVNANNTVDVVWQTLDGKWVLKHARKKAGDLAWSLTGSIPGTLQDVAHHSLAVEGNRLHLVWSESTLPDSQIMYSQGNYGGGNLGWSTPITLTDSLANTDALRPVIRADGGRLEVAFTARASADVQQVYHSQCSANCTAISSWSNLAKVSGSDLAVNVTNPREIYSEMAVGPGCTYLYFHGRRPGASGSENLWGVRNCGSGWSSRHKLPLSLADAQTIKPNLVIDGVWMHLVFERAGTVREVYYVRGNPYAVFMPAILRN